MKNQIKKLIQITSEVFEIEDIYSTSRQTHFVFARAIIFYLMRNNLFMTYVKIAKVFNKNHATIMHAVKQLPYMLKYDQDLQQKYNNIKLMWLENESHNFISKENSLKNLTDRNNLLNLMVEEYKSHTQLLNNKLLSMVNHEDCKYSVDDVDKIYNYTTWSVKKKVDTLLHIDLIIAYT